MTPLELNCLSYNNKSLETVSSAILLKQTVYWVELAIQRRRLLFRKKYLCFPCSLYNSMRKKAMNQIIAVKQNPGDPEIPVIYHETLLLLQHNNKGTVMPTLTEKPEKPVSFSESEENQVFRASCHLGKTRILLEVTVQLCIGGAGASGDL